MAEAFGLGGYGSLRSGGSVTPVSPRFAADMKRTEVRNLKNRRGGNLKDLQLEILDWNIVWHSVTKYLCVGNISVATLSQDLSPAYVAGLVRWNFSAELLQAEAGFERVSNVLFHISKQMLIGGFMHFFPIPYFIPVLLTCRPMYHGIHGIGKIMGMK